MYRNSSRAALIRRALAAIALAAGLATPAAAQEDLGPDDDLDVPPRVEAAREVLKQALPAGATREREIAYLLERERAAFATGAGALRLDALRRLVDLHEGAADRHVFVNALQAEEWRSGNTQRSLALSEALVADARVPLRSRIEYSAQLAGQRLTIGERRAASAEIDRAARLLAEYGRAPDAAQIDRATAIVEMNRASLLVSEGRYEQAETAARAAIAAAERAVDATRDGKRSDRYTSLYDSNLRFRSSAYGRYVHLLAASGRHVEAEAAARQGLQRAQADQTHGSTVGYWHARIAETRIAQGRHADARSLAERALAIYAQAGLGPSSDRVVTARMLKLTALLGEDRWGDADAEYADMLDASRDDAVARQRIASPVLRGLLDALNGRGAQAVEALDGVVRFRARNYGESNPSTIEAKAVRALALQSAGDAGPAMRAYREVFDALFSDATTHGDFASRGLRGFYLPIALNGFLRLVASEHEAGRSSPDLVSYAFTVTDRLRGSAVQQALVDSAARAIVAADPQLSALVRGEQDARNARRDAFATMNQRLNEHRDADREVGRLRRATETDPASASKTELQAARQRRAAAQADVDKLRADATAHDATARKLRAELAARFPAYQRLVDPPPARAADVAQRLEADEALLAVYTGATHTFVWALRRGQPARLHVARVGADAIAADVDRLRAALDIGDRPAPPSFNHAIAQRLYATLIEGVAPAVAGARSLTVVTAGALGRLPFALLAKPSASAGAGWLVSEYAISHVASASAWVALRDSAGKRIAAQPFIGFGDPLYAPGTRADAKPVRTGLTGPVATPDSGYGVLPPLPETRDEILALARSLGADAQRSTFFGAEANRNRVLRTDLTPYRVIAFATHGLRPGDLPNLSQPALALAAPPGAGEPELLTLDDVLKLRLAAEWVVLSACNTAAADGSSEEAISGLGRGFFYAGTRSMLVTHWAVETASARTLVTRIFEHYAKTPGATRAGSLRAAQLEMISGTAGAQYGHPFFWAPYALAGDSAR